MTTPFWCLTIVIFLPFLMSYTAGYFKFKSFGHYDNNNPRIQSSKLEGMGARAFAAHQNSWEAVIMFAPVVLMAHLAGANAEQSATAAVVFVIARLVYMFVYLIDLALIRSLVFTVGMACCVWLLYLAATV